MTRNHLLTASFLLFFASVALAVPVAPLVNRPGKDVGLSPPYIITFNTISAIFANDPKVEVLNEQCAGANCSIIVQVDDPNGLKPNALKTIMQDVYSYYRVQVISKDGSPVTPIEVASAEELQVVVNTAFLGCGDYVATYVRAIMPGSDAVFPIFSKNIIQFWADNLPDYYGNENMVRASAVQQIIVGEVSQWMIMVSSDSSDSNTLVTDFKSVDLAPPYVTLQRLLENTIGMDEQISVNIDSSTKLSVVVNGSTEQDHKKADSLATILSSQAFSTDIMVKYADGQSAQRIQVTSTANVVTVLNEALAANPLLKAVMTREVMPYEPVQVFPVFEASVTQFFNDNIGDYFGNSNYLTADAFGEIFRRDSYFATHPLFPSTEKSIPN